MWQKIKFFFLRRLSDEKLRMWCVEQIAPKFHHEKDYYYSTGTSISVNAERLYNYIRKGIPTAPDWSD